METLTNHFRDEILMVLLFELVR